MLKETSIEEHEKLFIKLQKYRDESFDSSWKQNSAWRNTRECAVNMKNFEPEDILTGSTKFFKFDREMVEKLIEVLNEGKFNLLVLTDKHSEYRKVEKWFGTEYDEIGK